MDLSCDPSLRFRWSSVRNGRGFFVEETFDVRDGLFHTAGAGGVPLPVPVRQFGALGRLLLFHCPSAALRPVLSSTTTTTCWQESDLALRLQRFPTVATRIAAVGGTGYRYVSVPSPSGASAPACRRSRSRRRPRAADGVHGGGAS